jgi:transcriptional regulator with XRE-family HTH domain
MQAVNVSTKLKLDNFGTRLKALRLSLFGLSREEFADKLNISEATIRSWEIGRTLIKSSSLGKLVEALNAAGLHVAMEWLTNGEGLSPFRDKDPSLEFSEKTIFFSLYQDAILLEIPDRSYEPLYYPGDLIGAIPANPGDLASMSLVILEGKKRKREIKKLVLAKEGFVYVIPPTYCSFSEVVTYKPFMKVYKIIWFKSQSNGK